MAGGINIMMDWLGLTAAESRFGRMGGLAAEVLKEGLNTFSQQVFQQAQAYTPVDTGATLASGTLEQTADTALGVEYTITFGEGVVTPRGKDAGRPYAQWPYFRTDLHHPVGRDHWIEAAVNEREGDFGETITNGLEDRLASG